MSILETIEAFYVVHNTYKVARLSHFVENIINKKSYEPAWDCKLLQILAIVAGSWVLTLALALALTF